MQTDTCLDNLDLPSASGLTDRRDGKVRSSWALPSDPTLDATTGPRRLFVTSDRLSAFDRIIGLVPGKGQMLNQLAWWWFNELSPITAHHALEIPDPNVLIGRAAQPLPVEVIVRRAITGVTKTSVWKRYEQGGRLIDGHTFRDGLRKNELLSTAIITPTTKGEAGAHDEPLSIAEVAMSGLVQPDLWEQVCATALAIFSHGEKVAEEAGLILADTKYEFGIGHDGTLLLIDEVHTPDSSRFWERSTYEGRLAADHEPESLDKEIIRTAFADRGYRGDGPIPELPSEVWDDLAAGYQRAYERITGLRFELAPTPIEDRIVTSLQTAGIIPLFEKKD
jgi:phosphoribosylaminoimidazole-succinocarboxamide synthase